MTVRARLDGRNRGFGLPLCHQYDDCISEGLENALFSTLVSTLVSKSGTEVMLGNRTTQGEPLQQVLIVVISNVTSAFQMTHPLDSNGEVSSMDSCPRTYEYHVYIDSRRQSEAQSPLLCDLTGRKYRRGRLLTRRKHCQFPKHPPYACNRS